MNDDFKKYAPINMSASTIIGSHNLCLRRMQQLQSAYKETEEAFYEYKRRVAPWYKKLWYRFKDWVFSTFIGTLFKES